MIHKFFKRFMKYTLLEGLSLLTTSLLLQILASYCTASLPVFGFQDRLIHTGSKPHQG